MHIHAQFQNKTYGCITHVYYSDMIITAGSRPPPRGIQLVASHHPPTASSTTFIGCRTRWGGMVETDAQVALWFGLRWHRRF